MRPILTLTTILTLALAPMALSAKPGNQNGNGHGNGVGNGNGHVQRLSEGEAHRCPPGLADRTPACVPPGLARQGVTTEEWIGPITTEYHAGDYLTDGDFSYVTDFVRYGLPELADGQRYAVIDGTLVTLDAESYQILQLLRAFAAVGN